MFNNTTIFIIIRNEIGNKEIKRLTLNRNSQNSLCTLFTDATSSFIAEDIEIIDFEVGYNPDANEVQKIADFEIEQEIIDALSDPMSVEVFHPDINSLPNIRSVFTGTINPEICIAFQKFNKSQYLTNKGISLLHSNGTLKKVDSFGISINTKIDCLYRGNDLLFKSYHNARQVFDLAMYYRSASDRDIERFINNGKIEVENENDFNDNADSWIRKKVALIQDSGVLDCNTVSEIAIAADAYGLDINTVDSNGTRRIVLPDEKKHVKDILKFLDEDIYKGVLSNITYETNSKRRRR